jgi:putative peptide zinc metalloprotease protein
MQSEPARGRRSVVVAVNSRDGEAVNLSPAEHHAVCLADGTHSRADLGHDELFTDLYHGGFLTDRPHGSSRPNRWARLGRALVRQELNWATAHRFVVAVHRLGTHRLFRRRAGVGQVILALAGVLASIWILSGHRTFHLAADPWQVPAALALNFIAVAVHEFGHAVVLAHHERRVRAIGFKLHLGAPTFYVDSVDGLLLDRRQRLVQAAAGPWAEWLITSVAAIAVIVIPAGAVSALLARLVVANAIGIAINLLPFVGLDGCLLLADLIRVPDLRARAGRAIGELVCRERLDSGPLWPFAAYAMANMAVAGILFVLALFFWYQLFGALLIAVWTSGPLGAGAVGIALGVLLLPVLARLAGPD